MQRYLPRSRCRSLWKTFSFRSLNPADRRFRCEEDLGPGMKEFRLFRRDKLLIMLAVLMPVVLMFLAGIDGILAAAQRTAAGVRLRQHASQPDLPGNLRSRAHVQNRSRANPNESPERALASWRGRAALIIPQNFERDSRRGAAPIVQLMIDATDSNAATALGNYAQALNTSFARKNGISRPQAKAGQHGSSGFGTTPDFRIPSTSEPARWA